MLLAQNIRHSKTLADVVNEKKERDENKATSKRATRCCVALPSASDQKTLRCATPKVTSPPATVFH
jgi:hypothetical protein